MDTVTAASERSDRGELELIAQLARYDEAAYNEVLNRYYPAMLHVAMGFVRSRSVAEEVVQDTWLAVITGIDRFEARCSFKTWLFRILVNRARTRGSRDRRCVTFSCLGRPVNERDSWSEPEDSSPPAVPPSQLPQPAASALDTELMEHVTEAINRLCGRQRQVLVLHDVEGWTPKEVCELLGISEANQRVLLHRARTRLRELVSPYVQSALGPAPNATGKSTGTTGTGPSRQRRRSNTPQA